MSMFQYSSVGCSWLVMILVNPISSSFVSESLRVKFSRGTGSYDSPISMDNLLMLNLCLLWDVYP
jgi:hypothetical protein